MDPFESLQEADLGSKTLFFCLFLSLLKKSGYKAIIHLCVMVAPCYYDSDSQSMVRGPLGDISKPLGGANKS